eukprot:868172-Prorocentrum_minimum.AAC.1
MPVWGGEAREQTFSRRAVFACRRTRGSEGRLYSAGIVGRRGDGGRGMYRLGGQVDCLFSELVDVFVIYRNHGLQLNLPGGFRLCHRLTDLRRIGAGAREDR